MKVFISIVIGLLLFSFITENIFAETKFSLSITGGKKKDEVMTISASITGSNCGDAEQQVVEVLLNGEGAGYPFAADFSNAQITAYLNGQLIPGHRRYVTNPPMINDLILHADPSFTFNPKKDTLTVYISGVRRGNVGGMSLALYLMANDRGNTPMYDSCIAGYKIYNTITPLSDSELLEPSQAANPLVSQTAQVLGAKKSLNKTPAKFPEAFRKLPFSSLAPAILQNVQRFFL
jgi:hypothetical protein